MQFTNIVAALGLTSLAAAAPAPQVVGNDAPKSFLVSNFNFGCTSGCYFNYDVAVKDHTVPVHCSGSLTQTDYIQCNTTGLPPNEIISGYIAVDDSTKKDYLKLQYQVSDPAQSSTITHQGEIEVYSQTGDNGAQQPKDFTVAITKSFGVA